MFEGREENVIADDDVSGYSENTAGISISSWRILVVSVLKRSPGKRVTHQLVKGEPLQPLKRGQLSLESGTKTKELVGKRKCCAGLRFAQQRDIKHQRNCNTKNNILNTGPRSLFAFLATTAGEICHK